MRSKAGLVAVKAYRLFKNLIEEAGWSRNRAFQVAFMGIRLFHIPGLKPVPEPDPPFSIESLYTVVKDAYANVSELRTEIKNDLDFLEKLMHEEPTN